MLEYCNETVINMQLPIDNETKFIDSLLLYVIEDNLLVLLDKNA